MQNEQNAEKSSGIGETQHDQEASDRDADGRRIWEVDEVNKATGEEQARKPRQSKDASGDCGNALDLTG